LGYVYVALIIHFFMLMFQGGIVVDNPAVLARTIRTLQNCKLWSIIKDLAPSEPISAMLFLRL
jgi:hypothetical protein